MFNCFPNCSLIYTPISNFEEPVNLPPFRHLILQNLKIFTNQMGAKSYLTAVLICTSLITDNVEHLFIFLLILSVSCSVKCFLRHSSFFFFSWVVSTFLNLWKLFLCISNINPSLVVCVAKTNSQSVNCLFTFFKVSFDI